MDKPKPDAGIKALINGRSISAATINTAMIIYVKLTMRMRLRKLVSQALSSPTRLLRASMAATRLSKSLFIGSIKLLVFAVPLPLLAGVPHKAGRRNICFASGRLSLRRAKDRANLWQYH